MPTKVLVISDDARRSRTIVRLLKPTGFTTQIHPITAEISQGAFRGIVVLSVPNASDVVLGEMARIRAALPSWPVVMVTEEVSAEAALSAMEAGACQWLGADRLEQRLCGAVGSAMQTLRTIEDSSDPTPSGRFQLVFDTLITDAPQMQPVVRAVNSAMESDVAVLIHGETGTGKELIARAIHDKGSRSGPFLAINCAGIPESLLEAELFGHERGAYTGATNRRAGVFEQARGGTLFLDEIGEMQVNLQAKLLRVLQSGDFKRLGGNEALKADVRVVAATNRDLESLVETGRFRADLFYRLAVFPIYLPPLRERTGDVARLLMYFTTRISEREQRIVDEVEPEVLTLLELHDFPGNVRELENIVSYAVLSCADDIITVSDLPAALVRAVAKKRAAMRAEEPAASSHAEPGPAAFPTLVEIERKHIRQAMRRAGGKKSLAASLLGISRTTLYRKLVELDLDVE